MARPLPCDNHPDQLASLLMTNLETGDTLTLCGPCVIGWAETLVSLQQLEPETPAEAPTVAEEVADLEPETPTPDAGPKSEPEPPPQTAQEAEHPPEATQEATAPGD